MIKPYLFETGGKTFLGYVDLEEHPIDGITPDDVDVVCFVTVMFPALVQFNIVPIQGRIQPAKQDAVSLQMLPMVFPYVEKQITIQMEQCVAFAPIPDDSFLLPELKRVADHFTQTDGKVGNA